MLPCPVAMLLIAWALMPWLLLLMVPLLLGSISKLVVVLSGSGSVLVWGRRGDGVYSCGDVYIE